MPKPASAKPPVASATRWAGQLVLLGWIVRTKPFLMQYDSDPADNTAALDDGSKYKDHVLSTCDWKLAEHLVNPLTCT